MELEKVLNYVRDNFGDWAKIIFYPDGSGNIVGTEKEVLMNFSKKSLREKVYQSELDEMNKKLLQLTREIDELNDRKEKLLS